MFCNRCGKKIDEGTMCTECMQMTTPKAMANNLSSSPLTEEYVSYEAPVSTKSRMAGFGMALVSTIFSFVAFIMVYAGILLIIEYEPEITLALTFVSSPFTIMSFIFGIVSMARFKGTKAPDPKPVPTFIFGIIGFVTALLTMLFGFIAFILACISM